MRRSFLILSAFIAASMLQMPPVIADGQGLSIGVEIKSGDSGNSDIGSTRNLWMAVGQGNTLYRKFVVEGSPKYNLRVIPEIHEMLFINDVPSYSSKFSPANDWVKFQEQFPTDFIVKAGKKKQFTMAITPPFDIPDQIVNAYLVVRVEAVDKQGNALSPNQGANVPLRAQLATPMWLGIGNPKQYKMNFRVNEIAGVKYGGNKYLRVFGQNDGKSPIAPWGRVQMKSLDFDLPTQGPFEFYTFGVKAQTPFNFDVEIPKNMGEGNWTIYVELRQGNYLVNKTFIENLEFKKVEGSNDTLVKESSLSIGEYSNVFLPLAGIMLLLFGYWKTQQSNRRLKHELALAQRPPDDSV